uniref:Uncharacterized protein n=1 Tax=Anguilla anguilla TaxID=7936 RepID=A0A0E9W6B3_ANGAN
MALMLLDTSASEGLLCRRVTFSSLSGSWDSNSCFPNSPSVSSQLFLQ